MDGKMIGMRRSEGVGDQLRIPSHSDLAIQRSGIDEVDVRAIGTGKGV